MEKTNKAKKKPLTSGQKPLNVTLQKFAVNLVFEKAHEWSQISSFVNLTLFDFICNQIVCKLKLPLKTLGKCFTYFYPSLKNCMLSK